MENRRRIFVFAIAGIALAALAAVGYLLFRGVREFAGTENELRQSVELLKSYYRMNPFPSDENIDHERRNVDVLRDNLVRLLESLREGQLEEVQRSPSAFMAMLGETRNRLLRAASAAGTVLPQEFAFGFDRYFESSAALPAPEDVPTLTRQLLSIEALCKTLFESGVAEVAVLERQHVEGVRAGSPAGVPGGRRARPRTGADVPVTGGVIAGVDLDEEDLYSRLRFRFVVRAREAAVLDVLNRLAADPLFVVVNRVEFSKTQADIRTVSARAATPAERQREEVPSRAKRIVSGKELERPMRVTLELDVYRFRMESVAEGKT